MPAENLDRAVLTCTHSHFRGLDVARNMGIGWCVSSSHGIVHDAAFVLPPVFGWYSTND